MSPLDSADWEILGFTGGNPVPGDPAAASSLAQSLHQRAKDAGDQSDNLLSVYRDNTGRMLGSYADRFDEILGSLPAKAMALSESYQFCSNAVRAFAETLTAIQQAAGKAMADGIEADEGYRRQVELLGSGAEIPIPPPIPPDTIWRGMDGDYARSAAQARWEGEVNPEDPGAQERFQAWLDDIEELGNNAAELEADRQRNIVYIENLAQDDYQEAIRVCVSAIQGSVPDEANSKAAGKARSRASYWKNQALWEGAPSEALQGEGSKFNQLEKIVYAKVDVPSADAFSDSLQSAGDLVGAGKRASAPASPYQSYGGVVPRAVPTQATPAPLLGGQVLDGALAAFAFGMGVARLGRGAYRTAAGTWARWQGSSAGEVPVVLPEEEG